MFNEEIRDMDFSGGIRATRAFQEAMPTANVSALFVQVFMTLVELMKVSPDGVEMAHLRARIHTADKEELNKQTFSRWIKAMAEETKPKSLLNLAKKEPPNSKSQQILQNKKRGPLIELAPSDMDPRAKKIKLTAEGLSLAQRMSRNDLERSYLDTAIEGYREHIDWLQSAEVQKIQELFAEGNSFEEVEEKLEVWRKENPDKTWKNQRNTSLDFDVPDEVDEAWLAEYETGWEEGEPKQRKMLEDVGIVPDDLIIRMMYTAIPIEKGKVRIDIPKDAYKEDGRMSLITAKFVAKAKMMGVLKRHGWDKTGLNIERVLHEALGLEEAVLKPSASPTGPNDIDLVNPTTGEVEGGVQVKATTNHPAASPDVTAIITMFTQQIDDLKKEAAEREQKLLERIDKLSEQLRENSRG